MRPLDALLAVLVGLAAATGALAVHVYVALFGGR